MGIGTLGLVSLHILTGPPLKVASLQLDGQVGLVERLHVERRGAIEPPKAMEPADEGDADDVMPAGEVRLQLADAVVDSEALRIGS